METFHFYKNQQTFKFSDESPTKTNRYVQPAPKFMNDCSAPIEKEYEYEDYGAAIKENIPKIPIKIEDPRRAYAQKLLNR